MKTLILLSLIFGFGPRTLAQTIYLPNIKSTATGTQFSGHNAMDVNLVGGVTIGSVNQGSKGTIPESWYVQPCDGTNCQTFNSDGSANISILGSLPAGTNNIGSVNAVQSGTWTTGRTWTLLYSTDSVSATQNGAWNVGITGTIPLPTGAATAANQAMEITSLQSIDSKTPSLGQAVDADSVPVVLPADQITTLTPPTTVTVIQPTGSDLHATIDSSALPTGAATSALQTQISGQIPATLGQKAMAASMSIAIASDQSSIPVTSNPPTYGGFSSTGGSSSSSQIFTAPASTKFLWVQADINNTDNIRFGSAATSTTVGFLLAPGQDGGIMPFSAGDVVTVVPVSGTQKVNITWIF